MAEEKKILTDAEKEQKSKKMDEVFETTSSGIFNDVTKIIGRDLTDEEKKDLGNSLKTYFVLTSLLMGATCK